MCMPTTQANLLSTLQSPLQSPCVRNCCLDNNDMCLGCFRQLDEILIWGQATDKQKADILAQCAARQEKRKG